MDNLMSPYIKAPLLGIEWLGFIEAETPGIYEFRTNSSDGSVYRLVP